MIRFGMGLMEIVEQLTKGFMKATGKQPGNLEKLKIQQEAVQRLKEMNKVVDMQGRAMDTTQPIIGGTQRGADLKSGIMKATGAKPKEVLSEEQIRQRLLKNNEEGLASMKKKLDDPEERAMGGRIGYKVGAGKKGVQALIDLIQDKFGKGAATTADKVSTPQKTLDREMFKKADKRLNDKRMMTDEEIREFADEFGLDPSEEYYNWDGTLADARRLLKESEDETKYMYQQYKAGRLDPVAGDKSKARKEFLEKKLEEMEMSGDKKLMTVDEIEELSNFDLQAEMDVAKALAPKMVERLELKQKYPGISDDLLDKILIDDNVQRKAEVLATMDEAIKMMQKGKSNDEIIDTMKNVTRTKQADGGRIGLKAGMTKRAFLKLMGGVGAGIAGAKTGLMSFAKKSEPVVEAVKETAQEVPSYFFSLVNKIKSLGDDTLATQDKAVAKKYKDYIMEEDFAGNIEIIKKGGDDMYPEDVFMSYKVDDVPVKGGSRKVEEYEEFTARPDMDGKMKDVEDGVPDNVIEEAMKETPSIKIKKASGGIARMLGE